MKVSVVILAGGKSTRMGRDKKFFTFRGKSFLERALTVAKKLSDEVIMSLGSEEQKEEVLDKGFRGVRIVVDPLKSKGPLMGLYSALKECTREHALVIPCDSPLLDLEVLKSMINESRSYDAVVPWVGGLIEPLHAVYRVEAMLEVCAEAIESNDWDVASALRRLKKIKYMNDVGSFLNVNTPEDFERLLKNEEYRR